MPRWQFSTRNQAVPIISWKIRPAFLRQLKADGSAQVDVATTSTVSAELVPLLERRQSNLRARYADTTRAQRALSFAAVNALSRHLFDRKGFAPLPAAGSLGELDLQTGDHLGMIGLFPPLVSQVRASGARLTVPELRADLAGAGDGASVTLDAGELAHCNKVLSTRTGWKRMLNSPRDVA